MASSELGVERLLQGIALQSRGPSSTDSIRDAAFCGSVKFSRTFELQGNAASLTSRSMWSLSSSHECDSTRSIADSEDKGLEQIVDSQMIKVDFRHVSEAFTEDLPALKPSTAASHAFVFVVDPSASSTVKHLSHRFRESLCIPPGKRPLRLLVPWIRTIDQCVDVDSLCKEHHLDGVFPIRELPDLEWITTCDALVHHVLHLIMKRSEALYREGLVPPDPRSRGSSLDGMVDRIPLPNALRTILSPRTASPRGGNKNAMRSPYEPSAKPDSDRCSPRANKWLQEGKRERSRSAGKAESLKRAFLAVGQAVSHAVVSLSRRGSQSSDSGDSVKRIVTSTTNQTTPKKRTSISSSDSTASTEAGEEDWPRQLVNQLRQEDWPDIEDRQRWRQIL